MEWTTRSRVFGGIGIHGLANPAFLGPGIPACRKISALGSPSPALLAHANIIVPGCRLWRSNLHIENKLSPRFRIDKSTISTFEHAEESGFSCPEGNCHLADFERYGLPLVRPRLAGRAIFQCCSRLRH